MSETFPDGFLWGAATAAYQIEGASSAEGKGRCIWDMFARKAGAVIGGENGDIACDHYNRSADDVALMQGLGLNAYRFSTSWPRIMPEGRGRLNQAGLDFYSRLVDQLLAANLRPFLTLFHWDFPLELFYRGGWLNEDSPKWFADYAEVLGRALGDRVHDWVTLNEPQCFLGLGHQQGKHAPGLQLPFEQILRAGHHALLAHGRAVIALRSAAPGSNIGYAPVGRPRFPLTGSPEDLAAARHQTFVTADEHCWSNAWWMDPVYLGQYPADGLKAYEGKLPKIGPDDLRIISEPIDFFGVNTYQGDAVKAGAEGPELVAPPQGGPRTAFDWPVSAEALYWGPRFFYERYKKPIYVMENGLSCRDWVSVDGQVHDPARIDFVTRYLSALRRAVRDGADVRGYFHWSLLDNFEWAEGYRQRFGLVHVDYATQKRTLKDSALWYREVAAQNGVNIPEL